MLDGELRAVGRLTDEIRLDSLLISARGVARLLQRGAVNALSRSETLRRLRVDSKTLEWLIGERYLEVKRMRHSVTRVTRDYVTIGSVTQFEAEYSSSATIARELGLAKRFITSRLRVAGHRPIEAPYGTRPIYRRCEIATTIETLKKTEDGRT